MRLARYILVAATAVIAAGVVPTVAPATADLLSRPLIESELVSHVTSTDATIEAQINTDGHTTTYEVWVGRYPECIEESALACESSGGGPAGTGTIVGTIAAGSSSPTSISVDIAKAWHALKPNSEYIYSVSATNSNWSYEGSTYDPSQVFKTAAAPLSLIESESASHVTPADAVLEASINDQGLEATYEFHLVNAPLCFTAPQPCERPQYLFSTPAGKLLGSPIGQSVSVDLNSSGITLSPGERYEYWVTATSPAGAISGNDQVLTAPKEPVSPIAAGDSLHWHPSGWAADGVQLAAGRLGRRHKRSLIWLDRHAWTPSRNLQCVCKHEPHKKHHASCLKHQHKHVSPTNKH
jgi:hypothetical protein